MVWGGEKGRRDKFTEIIENHYLYNQQKTFIEYTLWEH